jgi:hypothetical protein
VREVEMEMTGMEQTASKMELEYIHEIAEEIEIVGKIAIRIPKQGEGGQGAEREPDRIARIIDTDGQEIKRELFRYVMEYLDREIVLRRRSGIAGKGIELLGKRRYTFKTVFGIVPIKRIRIRHKADGSTEIPSAKTWGTPRQVFITAGLKEAACSLVVKQSFSSTVRQLELQTGQAKIISKSTVGNILHEEGRRLARAAEERAAEVFAAGNEGKRLLGRAEGYLGEEFFEQVWMGGQ